MPGTKPVVCKTSLTITGVLSPCAGCPQRCCSPGADDLGGRKPRGHQRGGPPPGEGRDRRCLLGCRTAREGTRAVAGHVACFVCQHARVASRSQEAASKKGSAKTVLVTTTTFNQRLLALNGKETAVRMPEKPERPSARYRRPPCHGAYSSPCFNRGTR